MKLEKEVRIEKFILNYTLKNYEDKTTNGLEIEFLNKLTTEDNKILEKMKRQGKIKLILEGEEPILDDVERRYLSGVIRPFRDKVRYIIKHHYNYSHSVIENGKEYIIINHLGGQAIFPSFDKDTMYKGMELDKEYTLEELGL